MKTTPIRVFHLYELAATEKDRLFNHLEEFANLSPYLKEIKAFGARYGSFFPMEVYDERGEDIAWQPSTLGLVDWFREMLQGVWRREKEVEGWWTPRLPLLLGLRPQDEWMTREEAQALSADNPEVEFSNRVYLEEVMKVVGRSGEIPSGIRFRLALLKPDWRSGEFHYFPRTDFQSAVYLLFRQSWRAKLCIGCGRYFIADKPPQLYCSTKCHGKVKRKRNLEWWNQEGSQRRKKKSKSKAKRKKGG